MENSVAMAETPSCEENGQDESLFTCIVCQSLLWKPASLPCGHNLCSICSRGLVVKTTNPPYAPPVQRVECPHCRAQIDSVVLETLRHNFLLDEIVKKLCPRAYAQREAQWAAYLAVVEERVLHICADQVVSLEQIALHMREDEDVAQRPHRSRQVPYGYFDINEFDIAPLELQAEIVSQVEVHSPSRPTREPQMARADITGNLASHYRRNPRRPESESSVPTHRNQSPETRSRQLTALQEFAPQPTILQLHYLLSQHLAKNSDSKMGMLSRYRLAAPMSGLPGTLSPDSALVCREPKDEGEVCALTRSLKSQLDSGEIEPVDSSKAWELFSEQVLRWALILLPNLQKEVSPVQPPTADSRPTRLARAVQSHRPRPRSSDAQPSVVYF